MTIKNQKTTRASKYFEYQVLQTLGAIFHMKNMGLGAKLERENFTILAQGSIGAPFCDVER